MQLQTLLKFRNRVHEKAHDRAGKWKRVGRLMVEPLSHSSQEALAAKKKRSLVFSFPLFPLTLFKLVFSDLHLAKAAELEEPVRKAKEQWRGKERYETGDVEG